MSTPPGARYWALCPQGTTLPDELPAPVSVASTRFPHRVEHVDPKKRDADGLTEVTRPLLSVLTDLHPGENRADLVEVALLIEASAADLTALQRAITDLKRLPTDHGDLVVLDYPAFSPMLSRDQDNPRSLLRLGVRSTNSSYTYTSPVRAETDAGGFRTLTFANTTHFDDLNEAERGAIGFTPPVRNTRDRLDTERIALVGVQKPATVAPTRVVDEATGRTGLLLALIDANRRYTGVEVIWSEALPSFRFSAFGRLHLFNGAETEFRRFTSDDAHERREMLADTFADIDPPGMTGDRATDARALAKWAKDIDLNEPAIAALLRTRALPSRVVIGVDAASALASKNPVTIAIGAYRDQLHLPELTDVEWDDKATDAMVGQELLRRGAEEANGLGVADRWQEALLFEPTSIPWSVAGIVSTHDPVRAASLLGLEADQLPTDPYGNVALVGEPTVPPALPDPDHDGSRGPNVLDLMLATAATLVCNHQPLASVFSEVLARHRKPNSPKMRGQIATSVLVPLLHMPAEGSDTARLYAAVSRTVNAGPVFELKRPCYDPLGERMRWPDLIGRDWFEIVDRARAEAHHATLQPSTGERQLGPAQILLALAAALCLETSPALRITPPGIKDNLYQLTLSGLGGRHGASKAEPFSVIAPLAAHDEGITQLWEAIVATIASAHPRLARSARWDPDVSDECRYTPYLTEYDLRDGTWGGPSSGRGHDAGTQTSGVIGAATRVSATAFVAGVFAELAVTLEVAAAQAAAIADASRRGQADPDLDTEADIFNGCPADAFFNDGIDDDVAVRIIEATQTLQLAAMQGRTARMAHEPASSVR